MTLIDLIKSRLAELKAKQKEFPGIKSIEDAIEHNEALLKELTEK